MQENTGGMAMTIGNRGTIIKTLSAVREGK
jgi:hypothetical protein